MDLAIVSQHLRVLNSKPKLGMAERFKASILHPNLRRFESRWAKQAPYPSHPCFVRGKALALYSGAAMIQPTSAVTT